MSETDLEKRVIALESALAHSQAEVQDLSDVIAGQWKTIDRMGRRLDRAEALLRRLYTDRQDEGDGPAPQPE